MNQENCLEGEETVLNLKKMKQLLEISKLLNTPRPIMRNVGKLKQKEEKFNKMPKFYIDKLINASFHQLLIASSDQNSTFVLPATSLASMTCWLLCSSRRQNLHEDDTAFANGNPVIDSAKSFLIDLMYRYPGLCHKALLVAVHIDRGAILSKKKTSLGMCLCIICFLMY